MLERKPKLHVNWIDPSALKIVKTLQDSGHETYFVGGCVRDLLVGIHPKDFDIATSAHPPEVKKLIGYSHIIGRRFRLVLVRRHNAQFEISTFRRSLILDQLVSETGEEPPADPTFIEDNFYGSAEEDAKRRDFTINSLLYDPKSNKILDFCKGLADIEANLVRMIGEPYARMVEDPIRILRAVRLAHRIGFKMECALRSAIPKAAPELAKSLLPRRREEYLKILRLSDPTLALLELSDLGVLPVILPTLAPIFSDPEAYELFSSYFRSAKEKGLVNGDNANLFALLVFAFLKVKYQDQELALEQIESDPEIARFLKEELGMFRSEISLLFKGIMSISNLKKVDYFLRKGERRRRSFLGSEGVELGLILGQIDFTLSPGVCNFWKSQLRTQAASLRRI